jgi:hypothetical protein
MIVLTGDSHTGALLRAYATKWPKGKRPENFKVDTIGPGFKLSRPFYKEHGNRISFTLPISRARFEKMTGRQALRFEDNHLYGFSLRMHSFKVIQNASWLTKRPWRECGGTDYEPISDAVLEAIIRDDIGVTFDFYAALIKNKVPFFTIEAPPVNPDIPILQEDGDKAFIKRLDGLYRDTLKTWLSERNIDVITAPAESADSEGFLKREYFSEREKDCRHGNEAYGALMLEKILDYLKAHHSDRPIFD